MTEHEHEWVRVWLDNIPLWTRCKVCNVEGTVTTRVETTRVQASVTYAPPEHEKPPTRQP